MPRLDNSSPQIYNHFGVAFDESDPGATQPIDICNNCANWEWTINGIPLAQHEIDHPDYGDDEYRCLSCNALLTDADN